MEKLNSTSLDIDLASIRDEIKLLLLRIKAMAVHKDMLLKQLNDVTEFGQQLNEKQNKLLDKEMMLIKEKEIQTHQFIEESHYRTKKKAVSFCFDDSLISETNNEEAKNIGLTEMKLVDGPRCSSCLLMFDNNDKLLQHNCVEHSLISELNFVSLASKMIRDVIPGSIVPDKINQDSRAQLRRYVCTVCGILCTTKGNLDKHKKTKACIQKCKSSVLNVVSLDNSTKILNHKLPRYCCPVCQFSCSSRHSLVRHMRNRGCEKQYKSSGMKDGSLPLDEFKIIPPETVVNDDPVQNLEPNLRMYSCPVCHFSCSAKYNLLRHMRNKGCEEKYLNTELKDTSEPLKELSTVLNVGSQDSLKECSPQMNVSDTLKVSTDARAESILTDYIVQNFKSKLPLYSCPVCHEDCSTKFDLLSHIRNKVCELKEGANKRKKSFVVSSDYSKLQHIFSLQPNANIFTCCICRKSTDNDTSKGRRRETGKDICVTCEERFPEFSLSRSNEDETVGKLFKCKMCNRSFSDRSLLLKHMRVHSAERPHMCTRCGKSYLTSAGLYSHMKKHYDDNLLQCKICSKVFRGNNSLKSHMVWHSHGLNFTCSVCGKGFAVGYSLKLHMRVHTGERPYSCSYCDKTFTMSCHLKSHISSHTGEKRLICKVCGKRFRLHAVLKKHMKIHIRKGELE